MSIFFPVADGKGTRVEYLKENKKLMAPFFSVCLEFVDGNCGQLNSNLLMLLFCQNKQKLFSMMKSTDVSCTLEIELWGQRSTY